MSILLIYTFYKGGIFIFNNTSLNNKNIKQKIIEYFKFNIVGMCNFLISQVFYLTLYMAFKMNYLLAYTITSAISITASYYLNSKYTFKNEKLTLKKFFLSLLIYIFEYALNLIIIIFLVNTININEAIAPIIAPVFSTIPVFFLMRLVIKKPNKKK